MEPGVVQLRSRGVLAERCRLVADHRFFQWATIGVILFNAIIMGLETWPALVLRWDTAFAVAHIAIQVVFVAELLVRIAAHGRRPLAFFRSGWNLFDFSIVLLSLLPAAGPLATVARLARVLRVGRLVSRIPELRLIIGTMLRSIPSMGHVVLLLSLLIYIYGVIGYHLFAAVDPSHWGSLGRAAHTLFVIITLEGWVDIMQESTRATSWAWLYYASFIVIAVFVVINLFIAVVMNNLEKARSEEAVAGGGAAGEGTAEIGKLSAKLDALAAEIAALRAGR